MRTPASTSPRLSTVQPGPVKNSDMGTSRAPEAADRVLIEISDSGPGIAADVLPHIFEPFFTTKPEGEGTGLGLSMVYGIVENHGGQIKAMSTPGEGATFVIQLPITPNTDGERNSGNDASCSSANLSGR
jgi:signal transduction histidine kinase